MHILCYLRGTIDLGLFYTNGSNRQLVGYADACYLSIHTKTNHKHDIYLLLEILLFH